MFVLVCVCFIILYYAPVIISLFFSCCFYCYCSFFSIVILDLITGPNKKDHAKWRRSGKSSTTCTNHNLYPFFKKKYKNALQSNVHSIKRMHCNTNNVDIYMCACASVCFICNTSNQNIWDRNWFLYSIDMRQAEIKLRLG